MPARKYSNEMIIKALESKLGNVRDAADVLGWSHQALYDRINGSRPIQQELKRIRESAIDFVESKLFEKIEGLSSTDIQFYLKTKGKHRGYTERFEITGADGNPMEVVAFGLNDIPLTEEARSLSTQLIRELSQNAPAQ